ncbi:hypothetical protein [Clostridium tertium]|uniref:Kynurenine formamidase n=1 Tax=Clostridium tertium TaxID=1559 RepID=A0A6N3GJL4_9CLOT
MIVDITQVTRIGKEYRDGSAPLKVEKVTRKSKSGSSYSTINFSCDVHNMGTHIDVMSAEAYVSEDRLVAEGIKFDVSHITDREVTLEDLDLSIVKEGVYVFFQTNWDKYLEDDEKYNNHPDISFSVIEYLASKNVNMIGIDALGLAKGRMHGEIDRFLGKEGKYSIENLTNLDRIPESNFKVYCLPIKVEGIDAWPARVLVEF